MVLPDFERDAFFCSSRRALRWRPPRFRLPRSARRNSERGTDGERWTVLHGRGAAEEPRGQDPHAPPRAPPEGAAEPLPCLPPRRPRAAQLADARGLLFRPAHLRPAPRVAGG